MFIVICSFFLIIFLIVFFASSRKMARSLGKCQRMMIATLGFLHNVLWGKTLRSSLEAFFCFSCPF